MNLHYAVNFLLECASPRSHRISGHSLAATRSVRLVPEILFGPDGLQVGDGFFESQHQLLVGYESLQMGTMVEVAEVKQG